MRWCTGCESHHSGMSLIPGCRVQAQIARARTSATWNRYNGNPKKGGIDESRPTAVQSRTYNSSCGSRVRSAVTSAEAGSWCGGRPPLLLQESYLRDDLSHESRTCVLLWRERREGSLSYETGRGWQF